MKTYRLVSDRHGIGIKCLICGMTSYNANDATRKYCGNCHQFHEILERTQNGGKGVSSSGGPDSG